MITEKQKQVFKMQDETVCFSYAPKPNEKRHRAFRRF